ncbi:30S ribosomal protein S20 [Candidatus Peregrinibacteria bacterium]|nr:30S ribosomal protein S20 [Candidatus Peregrinibacteria bacterium]
MPITRQAIKRVKQDKARTARNKHYNNHMKSMVKLMLGYIQKKETDKAVKIFPKVVSAIDVCAKKNLIHKNNAARKKARLQKALSNIQKGGGEKTEPKEVKEVKKAPKKEKAPKTEKKAAKKK